MEIHLEMNIYSLKYLRYLYIFILKAVKYVKVVSPQKTLKITLEGAGEIKLW